MAAVSGKLEVLFSAVIVCIFALRLLPLVMNLHRTSCHSGRRLFPLDLPHLPCCSWEGALASFARLWQHWGRALSVSFFVFTFALLIAGIVVAGADWTR